MTKLSMLLVTSTDAELSGEQAVKTMQAAWPFRLLIHSCTDISDSRTIEVETRDYVSQFPSWRRPWLNLKINSYSTLAGNDIHS